MHEFGEFCPGADYEEVEGALVPGVFGSILFLLFVFLIVFCGGLSIAGLSLSLTLVFVFEASILLLANFAQRCVFFPGGENQKLGLSSTPAEALVEPALRYPSRYFFSIFAKLGSRQPVFNTN